MGTYYNTIMLSVVCPVIVSAQTFTNRCPLDNIKLILIKVGTT